MFGWECRIFLDIFLNFVEVVGENVKVYIDSLYVEFRKVRELVV